MKKRSEMEKELKLTYYRPELAKKMRTIIKVN